MFEELCDYIQDANSDYNPKDPCTWICIDVLDIYAKLSHITVLPSSVAYEQGWKRGYHTESESLARDSFFHKGLNPTINSRFLNYPFNFTQIDKLRQIISLPRGDFETWMQYNNRPDWDSKNMTSSIAATSHTQIATPATTYDHIMNSVT